MGIDDDEGEAIVSMGIVMIGEVDGGVMGFYHWSGGCGASTGYDEGLENIVIRE